MEQDYVRTENETIHEETNFVIQRGTFHNVAILFLLAMAITAFLSSIYLAMSGAALLYAIMFFAIFILVIGISTGPHAVLQAWFLNAENSFSINRHGIVVSTMTSLILTSLSKRWMMVISPLKRNRYCNRNDVLIRKEDISYIRPQFRLSDNVVLETLFDREYIELRIEGLFIGIHGSHEEDYRSLFGFKYGYAPDEIPDHENEAVRFRLKRPRNGMGQTVKALRMLFGKNWENVFDPWGDITMLNEEVSTSIVVREYPDEEQNELRKRYERIASGRSYRPRFWAFLSWWQEEERKDIVQMLRALEYENTTGEKALPDDLIPDSRYAELLKTEKLQTEHYE